MPLEIHWKNPTFYNFIHQCHNITDTKQKMVFMFVTWILTFCVCFVIWGWGTLVPQRGNWDRIMGSIKNFFMFQQSGLLWYPCSCLMLSTMANNLILVIFMLILVYLTWIWKRAFQTMTILEFGHSTRISSFRVVCIIISRIFAFICGWWQMFNVWIMSLKLEMTFYTLLEPKWI